MLPTPVSFTFKRRAFRRNVTLPRRKPLDVLLSRARVTNLGVLLLAFFTAISLLFNLKHWLTGSPSSLYHVHSPRGILSTISRSRTASRLNHLIIVPGHAIWNGVSAEERLDEDLWTLEPYQRQGGRVEAFFQHILQGAELSQRDERSLVVFSGGQTRPSTTTTEGESYLRLALQANVFRTTSPTHSIRATSENYALDSFQNLLFSIARFHEYTGNYPEKITVVGYEMKRKRFTDLHRAAIRWPLERFHYIGVDPENEEVFVAQQGEKKNGYLPYVADFYGCHSDLLSKRKSRNPHIRFHSYYTSSPELRELMDWCPDDSNTLFSGTLPWS